jgi:hypothetical protein
MEVLITIWSHCQDENRGGNWGKVGPEYLGTLLNISPKYPKKLGKVWKVLTEPGEGCTSAWLEYDDDDNLIVHDWDIENKGLKASRNNGHKGGRVKVSDEPTGNPQDNPQPPQQDNPQPPQQDNPQVTHGALDRSRVDRNRVEGSSREEEKRPTPTPTFQQVWDWFAKNRVGYAKEDVQVAFEMFEGDKDSDGNWKWGQSILIDWRQKFPIRVAEIAAKRQTRQSAPGQSTPPPPPGQPVAASFADMRESEA